MVERDQHAAKPRDWLADILLEAHNMRLDGRDGLQCHNTKGDYPHGIQDRKQSRQMVVAIDDLAPGRAVIASLGVPRVAEHRVGNEDVASSQSRAGQQLLKRAASAIARQRNTRRIGAKPARRLGHEQHASTERPIRRSEHVGPAFHPWAAPAAGHRRDQRVKRSAVPRLLAEHVSLRGR